MVDWQRLILGLGLLMCALFARSEVPEPLVMGVKHHDYGQAQGQNQLGSMGMAYSQIKMPLGKFSAFDHIMVPSISLEQSRFDVSDDSMSRQFDAYTIQSQFLFIKKINEKWLRIFQISPSIHSDGKVFDDDAFSLMGLALWNYRASEHSRWTMGLGANRLFGEYQPIPLLSYRYQWSPNRRLDLGFPTTKFEQSWADNWNAFAALKPVGGNWRFEGEDDTRFSVSYRSWLATVGARYQIKTDIWLSLEWGQSLNREFDVNDGSARLQVEDTHVWMLSLGLRP